MDSDMRFSNKVTLPTLTSAVTGLSSWVRGPCEFRLGGREIIDSYSSEERTSMRLLQKYEDRCLGVWLRKVGYGICCDNHSRGTHGRRDAACILTLGRYHRLSLILHALSIYRHRCPKPFPIPTRSAIGMQYYRAVVKTEPHPVYRARTCASSMKH